MVDERGGKLAGFWICASTTTVSAGGSGLLGLSRFAARPAPPSIAMYRLHAQAVALAMVLVQVGDAVVGAGCMTVSRPSQDRLKTVGLAQTAVANLIALVAFRG